MAVEVKNATWWDTLRLQMHLAVPAFLLGVVVPNRLFVWLAARCGTGDRTMRFLRELRKNYRCDHLRVWFPCARTLLVLAPQTMEAALRSSENSPDPVLKKRAISRFAPESLVISSEPQARDRRSFNTVALDLDRLHRDSETFASIAVAEADRLSGKDLCLRWSDFQSLGERISHQIILGRGEVDRALGKHLARMLRRSNLLIRDDPSYSAFYERVGRLVSGEQPVSSTACLMHFAAASVADGTAGASTRVPSQVAFWFFVLKDAVELHVARTLALLAAHPDVQTRVRHEIQAAGTLTAETIDGLDYLGACVDEQLRLWTPVPLLLRRTEHGCSLDNGVTIGSGEQILMHAGFYHRDPLVFGDRADSFLPDAATRDEGPRLYVFSAHGRRCAGRTLVSFVLKATLAALLRRSRFELVRPALKAGRIPYLYDHFAIELRAVAAA